MASREQKVVKVIKILTDIIDPPYVDIKVGYLTLKEAAEKIVDALTPRYHPEELFIQSSEGSAIE